MNMTKIGGQEWQPPLDVFAGAVPSQKRHGRKAMTKVMDARSISVTLTAQADLSRQHVEGAMNVTTIQTVAPARNEEEGRHCSSLPVTPALGNVLRKHCAGRAM
jgi:hypothetical protein